VVVKPELRGIEQQFVDANGMRFSVATAGSGDNLALCLHGCPECWYSWHHQMPLLADLGYRVWAPDLRGYGESSRPPRIQDYAVEELLDDIAGLIDASGARTTMLLAHDWGGLLAWWFAMRGLRPIERLVVFNAPHPTVARERAGWRQRLRSWYTVAAQIRGLPEWWIGKDARGVPRAIERLAGRPGVFSQEDLEIYRSSAARPGALTAMFDYYRALGRGGGYARQLALGSPRIEAPTLLLWGTADPTAGWELTHGMAPYVRDLTIRYLPGVGHWSQQEAPEESNRILSAWLADETVPALPGAENYRESPDARRIRT
jgi:pimeloyl-ACP methyl ester carboxylesterase